jgi:glutaconyl-CoA/methylmalonyl-CoA decarboxylase subunit delta
MDDLAFGLRITVLGMGIVFGMLILLWALLAVVGRLDRPRDVEAEASSPAGGSPTHAALVRIEGADELDPALVAAITVAVIRHAEARRLQAAPSMRAYWPGSLLFASRWVSAGRTRQGQSWRRRTR